MTEVRVATLNDVSGIVKVHQSNEDIEKLSKAKSLIDKWKLGGPWMALETCAIHLNYLLNTDYFIPLVAEENKKIVGEAEIIIGEDIDYGKYIHISVIYVHKRYHRKGIGSLLMKQIFKLAQEREIHKITVNVEETAKGFYTKHGFKPFRKIFTYSIPITLANYNNDISEKVREINAETIDFETHLSRKRMCVGNYQSSKQMWFVLSREKYPFFHVRAFSLANKSFIIFGTPISNMKVGFVYMWGEFTLNTLGIIKNLAKKIGFREIRLGIQENQRIPLEVKYTEEIWYKET